VAGINTTYSFADVVCTITFPLFPSVALNGQGVGEIALSYVNNNTAQEIAADGSIMTTKILADNAHVTISIQQSSAAHHTLKQMFNVQYNSLSANWAQGVITVSSPTLTLDQITCTGVAFEKRADQPYQQQGQKVTWMFMAANMTYNY
jgi:hypothetical protein